MDIKKLLDYIPPSDLSYDEWLAVGIALKHEGLSCSDWDSWSRSDARYKNGECYAKWDGLDQASGDPVTAGTIVQMAKERGFSFSGSYTAFDWNDEISREEDFTPSKDEGTPIICPTEIYPTEQIVTFLSTLFDRSEHVGYVTEVYEHDGVLSPTRGAYDRTAGQLIDAIEKCGGDIGAVLGDYNPKAGAWVRVNPLDGKGVKDENVTDYRYVLIESDSLPVERQNALMRELELPIATLTYTGGKSLHAIVKVEAATRDEYRKRVQYIFDVCRKNGLDIDKSCKNPSRLSRLPGFMRNGKWQFLVDKNIGKASFEEWRDYVEEMLDDLPDCENLTAEWDDLPELAPPLIDGILRQGHKMLIAGPSKAGKSFALIELCIAIAEGKRWLGFDCAQGRVMYVNLELDRPSCLHRFKDVYTALGIPPNNLANIDIWNLRGKAVPMDKLVTPLIRRAKKNRYIAVIIDPIYKVITGDENSAEQMAHFCNRFDMICTEVGCSVIYCHHHSKGAQGNKKSMDRASGSGVFARDPDALLDFTELSVMEKLIQKERDEAFCAVCVKVLKREAGAAMFGKICPDDIRHDPEIMQETARKYLDNEPYKHCMAAANAARETVSSRTAWRIEGTLREFPKFTPIDLWFDYPIHQPDQSGILHECDPKGLAPTWQTNFPKRKSNEERRQERSDSIETAFSGVEQGGRGKLSELAEYLGVTEKTVRSRLKEHGGFWIDEGECGLKR